MHKRFQTFLPTNSHRAALTMLFCFAALIASVLLFDARILMAKAQGRSSQTPTSHPADLEALGIELPLGLTEAPLIRSDRMMSAESVALGERLFFDPILSIDRTTSCSTCHIPEKGFASSDPLAVGVGGIVGRRNVPTVLNRGLSSVQFWDGRAASLEDQALQPIESENELGSSVEESIVRLKADPEYSQEFQAAFGAEPSPETLARALADYERTLLIGDSGVDRFRAGDRSALSLDARQGLWLFESRGQCWQCHAGPNFTGESFRNTGAGLGTLPLDEGRFEITGDEADRGKFKTPTLRSLVQTAPYMHDGSQATLLEVVQFYQKGGNPNSNLDEVLQLISLSDEDVLHLVAFLEALSPAETQK